MGTGIQYPSLAIDPSACPHRQFHTLPGLLDCWAALSNSNPNACVPSREAVCTIFMMVFGMTRPGLEPMTYRVIGGQATKPTRNGHFKSINSIYIFRKYFYDSRKISVLWQKNRRTIRCCIHFLKLLPFLITRGQSYSFNRLIYFSYKKMVRYIRTHILNKYSYTGMFTLHIYINLTIILKCYRQWEHINVVPCVTFCQNHKSFYYSIIDRNTW